MAVTLTLRDMIVGIGVADSDGSRWDKMDRMTELEVEDFGAEDEGLSSPLGIPRAYWERLLAVVTASVDRAAPDAPEAVANEAAIRVAGWLFQRTNRGVIAQSGDVQYRAGGGALSALRASGALALLAPWRPKRAGIVG